MSEHFDRRELIHILTNKGFEVEPTGSHIGLFLLDEHHRRTGVRTAVPMGGHGRELGIGYIRSMAHHLHITTHDLVLYKECKNDHSWILTKLRSDGRISPRAPPGRVQHPRDSL